MAVDENIFPNSCYMAFMDNGEFSPTAKVFLAEQRLRDWRGHGAEQPCFGCGVDDCTVRVVQYHDQSKRYISPPKNPKPLR